MESGISESEIFLQKYDDLLQKVKQRWNSSFCSDIGISKSKVSRLFNGQFDIVTLIEMASFVGYSSYLSFKERNVF